jgi:hypothetical protein
VKLQLAAAQIDAYKLNLIGLILEGGDFIERQLKLEVFAAAGAFERKTKSVVGAAKSEHQQTLDTFTDGEFAEEVFGEDAITIDGADIEEPRRKGGAVDRREINAKIVLDNPEPAKVHTATHG